MQEAGDAVPDVQQFVVDKGVEEFGLALRIGRYDIVVCDGGGDEAAMAFAQANLMTRLTDPQGTVSLNTERDDEAVVLDQVAVKWRLDVDDSYDKVGAVNDEIGAIGLVDVYGAVLIRHSEVDGLRCELGMQLARLAVHARPIVVVDAVGHVAALLDFGQEDTATDGVDASCRDIKYISWSDFVSGEDFDDGVVLYAIAKLVLADFPLKSGEETGSRSCVYHVPHLRLASLAMDAAGHLVIGVNLYAQVALGVNELDEQGQLVVILTRHLVAEDFLRPAGDDADQVLAGPGTVGDDTGAGRYGADLPRFPYRFGISGQTLDTGEAVSAPDDMMQVGLK